MGIWIEDEEVGFGLGSNGLLTVRVAMYSHSMPSWPDSALRSDSSC